MKSELLAYINEITQKDIGFSNNEPQQINIFEEIEPEEITFANFSSVAKYKKYLETLFFNFKNKIDNNLLSIDKKILEDLIFEIKTITSHYHNDNICGKKLIRCDLVELHDRSFMNKKDIIKTKISAYLEAQKNILTNCKAFLNLRLDQLIEFLILPTNLAIWNASDTEYLELFSTLWFKNFATLRNGNDTKKDFMELFQKIFGLKIDNWEILLHKATTRKTDIAPFATKLHKGFTDYANSNL